MKHRIEDQAGKGYAGKIGTRISIRLSAPKAKSTGLRAPCRKQGKGALNHHPDQRDHLQPHNQYFAGSSCASRGVGQCPASCFFFKAYSACITAPDGYFLRLNPAWESTLDHTRDELKAKRFFDFVNPDDVGATRMATITKMSRS